MTPGRLAILLTVLLAVGGLVGFVASGSFAWALLLLAAPFPSLAVLGLNAEAADRSFGDRAPSGPAADVADGLDRSLRPVAAPPPLPSGPEDFVPGVPPLPERAPAEPFA